MIKPSSDTEIRAGINKELKRPLSDGEWNMLELWKWIDLVRNGQMAPAGIAAKVLQTREAFGTSPDTNDGGLIASPNRSAELSQLILRSASEDIGVIRFRKDVLGGSLLQPHKQEEWIRKQAEQDGPITVFLYFPAPEGIQLKFRRDGNGFKIYPLEPIEISSSSPATATEVNDLAFVTAKGMRRRIPVSATGTLERLRLLSEDLSKRYNWAQFEATSFILANASPSMPRIAVDYEANEIPALARLHLIVDPALSPKEVSSFYRAARSRHFSRRHRSLNEKHQKLALFASSRADNETYRQLMTEWNVKYPKWEYATESNFGRDIKVATQRTLGFNPFADDQ